MGMLPFWMTAPFMVFFLFFQAIYIVRDIAQNPHEEITIAFPHPTVTFTTEVKRAVNLEHPRIA